MVDSLGQLAICLALALSLYAATQAVLSVSGRAPARLRAARNGLYANFGPVSLGCLTLIRSFATPDFSVAYAQHLGQPFADRGAGGGACRAARQGGGEAGVALLPPQ